MMVDLLEMGLKVLTLKEEQISFFPPLPKLLFFLRNLDNSVINGFTDEKSTLEVI